MKKSLHLMVGSLLASFSGNSPYMRRCRQPIKKLDEDSMTIASLGVLRPCDRASPDLARQLSRGPEGTSRGKRVALIALHTPSTQAGTWCIADSQSKLVRESPHVQLRLLVVLWCCAQCLLYLKAKAFLQRRRVLLSKSMPEQ